MSANELFKLQNAVNGLIPIFRKQLIAFAFNNIRAGTIPSRNLRSYLEPKLHPLKKTFIPQFICF